MRVASAREGRTLVFAVQGRVVIGESAEALSALLAAALADPAHEAVAVDLSAVDQIDSTGLGELVGHLSRFQGAGKRLTIRRPAARVRALLEMARLTDFLPIES